MPIRIGLYVCHCGVNIAGKVRVDEVAEFARGLDGVVVARDYKFMCSDPGQELIQKDIREKNLTRVVVASCSPRLHGRTFMDACRRAGLNPYLFQMASIREQVSWVTQDPDVATDKAKSLVQAAIGRVRFHQRLEAREAGVHPDVMVVGAGIAGMQAALDIAESGHKVYLVERSATIGGHMLQFDKTFPTLDCAACIGTPKMVAVGQHPNIELLTLSQVAELTGFIGSFTARITRQPRYVDAKKCTGCGECARVCPVSTPSEWDQGLIDRKAVYRDFPQAVPITFRIDKKDRAPCVQACPAGVNVQGYVQLVKEGQYERAVRVIMERLPLPGVLGRVCPHPCEAACRRTDVDEPVSIRELKRFAADRVDWNRLAAPLIAERKGNVAVVGSGPAGLTAAYFLRLWGYRVTLFEALPVLGGMLRVGIPDYRLPPEVLDREIGYILRLGVQTRTGVRFGRDITFESLKEDGFSAVFLGIGAHGGLSLNIPGEDHPAVLDAVGFLREVNLGGRDRPGPRVVVIGGGNVAVDAARAARRLGSDTTILYRRTRTEMPAYAEEIEDALDEGIGLETLVTPVRIRVNGDRVTGLDCLKNELGPPDGSGRRRPVPIEGSEFTVLCDGVITAIGQRVVPDWPLDEPGPGLTRRGLLEVDPRDMQTAVPGIFAAGDAVTGPATVIEAVAAGTHAAYGIQCYLEARPREEAAQKFARIHPSGTDWAPIPEKTTVLPRAEPSHQAPDVRTSGFDEAVQPLSEINAQAEAGRCLNCGGCSECRECETVCEARAIDHRQVSEEREIKVGCVILATGFDLFDPTPLKPFGYGRYPNVFTSLEFERLNNATGPTGGAILMRGEDGRFTRPPQSVAIIHCVGSRDVNYHEYCSRVCCMYALKYGHLIHDKVGPDARIYDFYIDLRCYGKGYEEFYRRCQEEGIHFIRGKPAQVDAKDGKLVVTGEDTLIGRRYDIPVDMVILCAAMEPRGDAEEVGRVFGVSRSRDGFFLEEHPKLAPLSTASDGIFLAGTCQAPRDVPDAVAHASGAAAKALSLVTRGRVQIEPTTSFIDPDLCAGCQICVGLCAYSAIRFDERRRISVVNEALCKGCGSCSGFCPSGAAQSRHFRTRQLFSEIDGIFDAIHALGR